jgi:hypothetical protein
MDLALDNLIPSYNQTTSLSRTKTIDETFEKCPYFVIPAKVGIHKVFNGLDSGFRGNDDVPNFRSNSKLSLTGSP